MRLVLPFFFGQMELFDEAGEMLIWLAGLVLYCEKSTSLCLDKNVCADMQQSVEQTIIPQSVQ